MRYKPYKDIDSMRPEFLEAVVADAGIPDNFAESAEGAIYDLPDPKVDSDAKAFLDRLMAEVAGLEPASGNGRDRS
jgi:hypothetical protein